jgi:hypothetical protein
VRSPRQRPSVSNSVLRATGVTGDRIVARRSVGHNNSVPGMTSRVGNRAVGRKVAIGPVPRSKWLSRPRPARRGLRRVRRAAVGVGAVGAGVAAKDGRRKEVRGQDRRARLTVLPKGRRRIFRGTRGSVRHLSRSRP